MAEYSKEQLQELYEQLPEELQEAVFSTEIGQKVQDICYDNNVAEKELYTEILKNVGYVFLGILTPEDFAKVLEKDLKVNRQIHQRINNEIFMELKDSLEGLFGVKIEFQKIKQKTEKPKEQDKYREPLE